MSTMSWEPEAAPKTKVQIRSASRCPEVVEAAIERGIASIVHFTRTQGMVGILASSAIKARSDLASHELVKHVYKPNAVDRSRDWSWHQYVNLSVTGINRRMFRSSQGWHPNAEWVVLEFGPEVLGDSGVVFCTTNNAYPVVHRGEGLAGFEQMFAPEIPWGYQGSTSIRREQQTNQTTDPQAEVLYPSELSLDHLHTITVRDEDTYDSVVAALASFPDHQPRINLKPKAFR